MADSFIYMGVHFNVIECYKCGVMFGMTAEMDSNRHKDKKSFYCPNGHGQVYCQSTEEKLRKRLEREQGRVQELEQQKHRVQAQYKRIRKRIKNGVCPCCNRSFQNLANHMKSQHPEFADDKQLKTLRLAYGLTQGDLAAECGVSPSVVSNFENGRHMGDWAKGAIENWIEQQAG